jgi:hypothetical protein
MAGAVRDETVEVWDSRLRLHVKIAGDGPPLLFSWTAISRFLAS